MDAKLYAQLFASIIFHEFKEQISAKDKESETIDFYTPHGVSHSEGVSHRIDTLLRYQRTPKSYLNEQYVKPLTSLERTLLKFCAWGHDIGMIESIAEQYYKIHGPPPGMAGLSLNEQYRYYHDKASAYYIHETIPSIVQTLGEELRGGRHNDQGELEKKPDELKEDYFRELSERVKDSTLKEEIHTFLSDMKEVRNQD